AGRGDRMSQPWSPLLLVVRERLESLLGTGFDDVFVNRYRDGRDSVAWHGDHEVSGKVVASLSLGATREFDLRPKRESDLRPRTLALDLAHGERKDPRVREQRINEGVQREVRIQAP